MIKKIVSLILCVVLVLGITGCGNNENDDKELKENNQKDSEVTNKILECTDGYSEDDLERTYTYKFTYDKNGNKLETIDYSDSITYIDTKLSDYNIGENKNWCSEANTYGGLVCVYEISDDKKVSTIKYTFDFNNLDNDAKEILESEMQSGLENYNYNSLKNMLENNRLTCK